MPEEKISAVITAYNQKDIIKVCLETLLAQDKPCSQIIVVDCGSTDGTAQWVRQNYPQVLLIERSGEYVDEAKAVNLGVAASACPLILLLNADVKLEAGCLKELAIGLEAHPGFCAAIPKILNFDFPQMIDAVGHRPYFDFYPAHLGQDENDSGQYDKPFEVFGGCLAGALVKKEAFSRIGPLDEDFCYHSVDDFFWRFNLAGFKCIYIPWARMYHQRKRSRVSPGYVFFCERNRIWSLIKYYPLLSIAGSFYYTLKRLWLSVLAHSRRRESSSWALIPALGRAWFCGIFFSAKAWQARAKHKFPAKFAGMGKWLNKEWVSLR